MSRLTPPQTFVLVLSIIVLVAGVLIGHRVGREGSNTDAASAVEYTLPDAGSVPITVHVVGAVQRPGLYALSAGARVRDAIRAAGGLTADADEESVNLAAFVDDGAQVLVEASEATEPEVQSPRRSRPAPDTAPRATPAAGSPAQNPPTPPRSAPVASYVAPQPAAARAEPSGALPEFARAPQASKVRLNRAGLEELQRIPGVGPELAKNIIYHRSMHGPFSGFDELDEVPGIGPATIEKIRVSATLN